MGAHLRKPWQFRPPTAEIEEELLLAIEQDGSNRNAWVNDAVARKLNARRNNEGAELKR